MNTDYSYNRSDRSNDRSHNHSRGNGRNNNHSRHDNVEKRKRKKNPSISPIKRVMYIIFWLTIIIMSGGLIINQASQYNELRRELATVQTAIEHEMFIHEDLQLRLTLFDSDAYIIMLARERLGMVFPWQIVFRNYVY